MLLGGRLAGSSFAYAVAHLGGGYVLRHFGGRFPRLRRMLSWVSGRTGLREALGVSMGRLTAATSTGLVATGTVRAPLVVALARLTPGLLTATSLASGVLGLPYRYFVLGIGLASIGGDLALLGLGLTVERTLNLFGVAVPPWLIAVGFTCAVVLGLVIRHFVRQRRGGAPEPAVPGTHGSVS